MAPAIVAPVRGRLEALSGRLLCEGELVRHGPLQRARRPLDAPSEADKGASDEYWIIHGMNVPEGTSCVLVIAGEWFDVRVVNGTLRKR